MKTIHAYQQRAEANHASRQRQLPPLAAMLVAGILVCYPFSTARAATTAADELRAAKLLESTLYARQATPEEWQKLERIYQQLVAKYPKNAELRNAFAEWLWTMGEQARAVDAWLAAEKIDPNDAVVLDHLGGSFLDAGEPKKAARYYARASASAPENAAYHYSYANVAYLFRHELLDAARPDAAAMLRHALTHFADASRLEPLNVEYARGYAETFYTIPDPDWHAALLAWQHLYEIAPQKDFALLNLARVQLKLGNKPEARACLARVQSAKYDGLKNRLRERIDTE